MTTRQRRRRRHSIIVPVLLLAALLVAAVDVFPVRQLITLGREAAELRTDLTSLREQNLELEQEIDLLRSPAGIERIARADFGYVQPGEVSYVVIIPEEPISSSVSDGIDPVLEPVGESGGILTALWEFIAGIDPDNG